MTDKEKQITAMRKIGMTDDEIKKLLEYDNRVNHGEDDYKLTPEQEKVSKKARNIGTRKTPTVYKLDNTGGKRSRKEDAIKGGLIAELFKFLSENSEFAIKDCEIVNKERMISFSIGTDRFEVTLTRKQKPKN